MTFGSLFAGIGGFDLGFERAGMTCKWQVEIDPFCRKVLAKHWPEVRRHDDVRTFATGDCDGLEVDVICGGFPCQDISNAGLKAGIEGERSGLWTEMFRVVCSLRPRYVVVENVAAILVRGHERILGDMASIGFDGEWEVLSACAFGASHSRERMFYIFHTDGNQLRTPREDESQATSAVVPLGRACKKGRLENWWATQPEPCSVVYGVSGVVDRLRPYGNAVIPQIAEWIGRRLTAHEPRSNAR